MHTGIIVIGGGAAGLMAAYTLAKAGQPVTVLEGRDRLGGRIHTIEQGFSAAAEAGAEFVHGNLPVTLGLLKEAGIRAEETDGEFWKVKGGKLTREADFLEHGDLLMKKLDGLQEDTTIGSLLEEYFSGTRYEAMRASVKSFVEGYDAADVEKASAFALREEWEGEDDQQYRPEGSYGPMIGYLEKRCVEHGVIIELNTIAAEVSWQPGNVQVTTANGTIYKAREVIVTIPLSLLQAAPPVPGAICFVPEIPAHMKAAQQIGMGHVIKLLLEFSHPFWLQAPIPGDPDLSKAAFIFSEEAVPTWWTQVPRASNLLTGWLAGPKAHAHAGTSDAELIRKGLNSLAGIFRLTAEELEGSLVHAEVYNWSADPFSRGAYAYNTVDTVAARKTLLEPAADTIYFAGEALYEGKEMGTVEAALSSGQQAAGKLLERDK